MKHAKWQIVLGIGLVALSALLYGLHYLFFHDPHHIFIYLVGDIAFVPVEVLLVTLIIHQVLSRREKRAQLEKMNMVIGAFFSEVGTELLLLCSRYDQDIESKRTDFIVTSKWDNKKYVAVIKLVNKYSFKVNVKNEELKGLGEFLANKRDFLLRLLENPNLLEHESFTDLLWAVFHLAEELCFRKDIVTISDNDRDHIARDTTRAYKRLVRQWLQYINHLKNSYPYLFSLALRTNPFDESASVEVQ